MDVIHHAMIGGVGFVALAAQEQELAGIGFLVGSVMPDLDVAFMAFGKRFYLRRHQGPTHSLPLAVVYAAGLAAVAALAIGWDWALFAAVLAGLCVHVLLDLSNTFGIQILWPFTPRRFCLDAVFFIDTATWGLTLGFFALVFLAGTSPGWTALAYGTVFACYVLAKLVLQRCMKRRLGVGMLIPTAFNPFVFLAFSKRDGKLEIATVDALSGRISAQAAIPAASPETSALASRSAVFRDMQLILRGLQIISTESHPDGTTIVARDLAVRNFGGKFGRTELRFDHNGKLVHEVADI